MFNDFEYDIAVIGLGLMGMSFVQALNNKNYRIWGLDINEEASKYAIDNNFILNNDYDIEKAIKSSKIVVLAVMPKIALSIIKEYKHLFSNDKILSDFCGVKRLIYEACTSINYIGVHTMAGREVGGYKNATKTLFDNCNTIITHNEVSDKYSINIITDILKCLNVGRIIFSDAYTHDKKIAFTSQLMHIVAASIVSSSEYIPSLGFEGNSLMDHTRVGTIDYNMWSEIFTINSDCLFESLSEYISILEKYKKALKNKDEKKIKELLKNADLNKGVWLNEKRK